MKFMRDVFISGLCERMAEDDSIYFVSADLGAPTLDRLREEHPDRFINVGIAEQSCINTATGLALEGYNVYAYGISAFISMRCFEQCRINLSLTNVVRPVNITVLGLGAGLSYDISGPSHHCLEDISIMRTLPGIEIYSPSTLDQVAELPGMTLDAVAPRYVRLDGKSCPESLGGGKPDFKKGFEVLRKGAGPALVATGYMTRTAVAVAEMLAGEADISVIDAFRLDGLDTGAFCEAVREAPAVITLEEAFIGCGGLDSLVAWTMQQGGLLKRTRSMGIPRSYEYSNGDREYLHRVNGIDAPAVAAAARQLMETDR